MPVRSVAEELAEYDAVTLDAVCGVARQAHASSLLTAPESADDLGYARATRDQSRSSARGSEATTTRRPRSLSGTTGFP